MRSPLPAVHRWWDRHDGLDGAIRTLGAAAVVVTIEALAGYFLWRGVTESIGLPAPLGWTLQVGLTGGSVVGTRAFHRGDAHDQWWGLAASLFAVGCVVADAAVAALLLSGQVEVQSGTLAVVVLVECLVIGYLTVHTLMARPRVAKLSPPIPSPSPSTGRDDAQGWGGPETVTPPVAARPATPAPATSSPTALAPAVPPRRVAPAPSPSSSKSPSVVHVAGWQPGMEVVAREQGQPTAMWLCARARLLEVRVTRPNGNRRSNPDLRHDVETAELERARSEAQVSA